MMAVTLYFVSRPNFLEDCRYLSLSSIAEYQSAVLRRPVSKSVDASQPNAAFARRGLAYQSLTSHCRSGMENWGRDSMPKTDALTRATSAMVVFRPDPMLNDSPYISGCKCRAVSINASQASST